MVPTRYRSIFSGQEIDELLSTIQFKLDGFSIVNEFTTGGATRVASAETVKLLKSYIDLLETPDHLKTIMANIEDDNFLTDALYTKLLNSATLTLDQKNYVLGLSDKFKGSFATAAARNAIITTNFMGGELTFLLDDGYGYQTLDFWDNNSHSWKKFQLSTAAVSVTQLDSLGISPIITFDSNVHSTVKIVITATNTDKLQTKEVLVSSDGVDTYITELANIGNYSLMDVSTDMTGSIVRIRVDNKVLGTTYKATKVVEQ